MSLSYDLISEFVKITNDKKDDKKEGTIYATVVSGTEGKYVRIDGSDLLTPMDTTTDIEDGERVTLMIKDHKAIVTGNVTTPSASTTKVDKVSESVKSVSDRVGTFELVVADKVSTNELEAYKATIEVLIANKATIEDLTVTNAKIENLEVKNAEIENLVAGKATIEDLEAVNATIENLKVKDAEIENAVVENLKATTADIKILNADFAQIKTLVNGNLTSDNILSFNLTSEKVTVDDAFIKDAMIDTISAGKINAGKINTNSVSIGSEDGGMLITGSTQQFTDKNGNVRIQIGKDASGDFTFILYGEDGRGQLINQNGITASAISDGLIVNDMVSDHAAISGGKLDISSVITEINSDNSTTIKSSKIYLNEQAQSLEVAFNSLKTKVDTIQEVTIQGDLTAIVEQVQSNTSKIEANKDSINTLISEDTVIKKQVTDLQGTLSETETTLNSKYTSLSQNLDGFKTTVADTYATKKSVTDVVDNIETNYSTTSVMNSAIEQKAQEISASVSSTYATKNEVSTLDNNLRTNYSTTQQMESAINVAKEEINLGVSSIYETKENTTSKIQNAVNDIQVGGTNLWSETTWEDGVLMDDGFASDYWVRPHVHNPEYIDVSGNNYLTYQVWNPNGIVNANNFNRIIFYNSNREVLGIIVVPTLNGEIHQTYTWAIPGGVKYIRLGIISDTEGGGYNTSLKFKIEFGNKPTEWSPNPLDVTNNITTAKNDAITSANNNTSAVIQNYYTKAQTDSQINIAKEAINLGVSSTYETKTNVQNKIDNIQVGGTNLWILSDLVTGWINTDGSIVDYDGIHCKSKQTIVPTNGARQLVYQCWNPNRVLSMENINRVGFFDSNRNHIVNVELVRLNGDTYQRQIIDIPDNADYMRLGAICGPTGYYDETIKIKFELGNKATDYSLAPEDVQSEFSAIESETRSIRETMTSLQLGTDSISASVKSLEESMVNTTNGLASDISRVQEQVNLAMTSSDVKLEIQKELADGVKKVSTSTGFTFDENGLNISKSDSEMKTQITEDGMKIYKNSEVMLTANNQGVDAKNLHATTYLIIGDNSRMEDFTENGNKRTAIFWIG